MAYRLNKWRHPKTEILGTYLNGLEETKVRVWYERGKALGSPAVHEATLCTEQQVELSNEAMKEVSQALQDIGLPLDGLTWERLGKEAEW